MRKRNIKNLFDNIFWYTLYMLPIIAYLIYLCVNPFVVPSIKEEVPVEPLTVTASADEVTENDLNYFSAVVLPAGTTFSVPVENNIASSGPFGLAGIFSFDENSFGLDAFVQYLTFVVIDSDIFDSFSYYDLTSSSISNIIFCFHERNGDFDLITICNPIYFYVPSILPISYVNRIVLGNLVDSFIILRSEEIPSLYQSFYYFDSSLDLPSGDGETIIISPENYTFEQFVEVLGFGFATDNIVVNTIQDIFGVDGIMPLFKGSTVAIITGWMVSVYLIHLAVDFILFIPRCGHKFLKNITED